MHSDCDFCGIARGVLPALIVWESESMLAFFPAHPATRGHTLVVPREHVRDFLELPEPLSVELTAAVLHVARAVQRSVQPDGMNVVTSAGRAASQTVFHLHVHVVPRWFDDAIGGFWPPPGADDPGVDALAARIRAAAAE
jgi:histidine triad (HIT) family protein